MLEKCKETLCDLQKLQGGTDLFALGSADRSQRNGFKVCQGTFRLGSRKMFFTERLVKQWNKLPPGNGDVPRRVGIPEATGQCSWMYNLTSRCPGVQSGLGLDGPCG